MYIRVYTCISSSSRSRILAQCLFFFKSLWQTLWKINAIHVWGPRPLLRPKLERYCQLELCRKVNMTRRQWRLARTIAWGFTTKHGVHSRRFGWNLLSMDRKQRRRIRCGWKSKEWLFSMTYSNKSPVPRARFKFLVSHFYWVITCDWYNPEK